MRYPMNEVKSAKIIQRNYGSIPHLSTSKLTQQADKKIELGQEEILTKKTRDWKDLVIVTEKLDGSNVGVIRKEKTKLIPIIRAGYHCDDSPHKMHHYFTKWMRDNSHKFEWIPDDWRICGEWMIQAHGTIYDISEESPFVAFDIFNEKNERIDFIRFHSICFAYQIQTVKLLHIGQPISISNSIKLLGKGHYGNPEKPEGFVYRLEREGKVEFLAKWVDENKEDGKYLEQEIWNKGSQKFIKELQ